MKEISKEIIKKGLLKLGLKSGDVILVHSSLKSFGYVKGGADAVIDALTETVGKDGTVLAPTFTGSEELSASNPPVFDVRNTSCWTGLIPETFRKRKGVLRSLHPTHSVAITGALSAFFAEGHENSPTPCGKNSPYEKLASLDNSYILGIGVGLNNFTMFHHTEELAEFPYNLQSEPVNAVIIDMDGKRQVIKTKIHQYGFGRDFAKMEPFFIEKGIMNIGNIGKSILKLVKAKEMVSLTLDKLREDPYFLLSEEGRQKISGKK